MVLLLLPLKDNKKIYILYTKTYIKKEIMI